MDVYAERRKGALCAHSMILHLLLKRSHIHFRMLIHCISHPCREICQVAGTWYNDSLDLPTVIHSCPQFGTEARPEALAGEFFPGSILGLDIRTRGRRL